MSLSGRQFAAESGVAYLLAFLAIFPLAALIDLIPYPDSPASAIVAHFLGSPVLGLAWLTAAGAAWLVHLRARSRPRSIFAASRAGEWVWALGAIYIVWGFSTYLGIRHRWLHTAIYELFESSDDIGNIVTAPFYMGIAYSLTRHLLRRRTERGLTKRAGSGAP